MKGIILAGGTGSRLYPLTKVTNKHLLPIYNKPMIYYPIQTLIDAGIKEIMIVTGKDHSGHFIKLLGSGKELGVKFYYGIQNEAKGIAHALNVCRDFSGNDKIIVVLGDNVLGKNIRDEVKSFEKQEKGAKIFLKEVKNPGSYGVVEIKDNKIINIKEKPKNPKTNIITTGIYMYDNQVWSIIKKLKPSKRKEYEITDVNNFYIKQGTMTYENLRCWWVDVGESFDTLLEANKLVAKNSLQS